MEEEQLTNYQATSAAQNETRSGTAEEGRPSRQRASTACLSCRSRRVRCDVLLSGKPCNNCKLDGVNCVVTRSKRGKRVQQQPPATQPPDPMSPAVSGEAEDLPMCLTFDERRPNEGGPPSPGEDSYTSTLLIESNSQNQGKTPQASASTSRSENQLPAYIRPLPSRLSHAEIEYLRFKGALSIPDQELCRKLLQCFVQYVDPFLPILDLAEFLKTIQASGHQQHISLILFQAVMFISVGYVDENLLIERGFADHREARQVFFGRVRALYDADVEKDRMVLIQTLLIMSYWYNSPDDEKDTWYWMGLCLSSATVFGLHRNPKYMNLRPSIQRLRKRVWWSCYMRDQLIGLGMRRPARISMTDSDVPPLEISDFDTEGFAESIAQLFGDATLLPRTSTRKGLAVACIDLSKLCTIISHILQSQYSILGDLRNGDIATNQMIAPKDHSSLQLAHLVQCDQDLTEWLEASSSHETPDPPTPTHPHSEDQILFFHHSMLKLIYYASVAILHRPQVFQATRRSSAEEEQIEVSEGKLMDAATSLTHIVTVLHSRDLVKYMPTTAVPALVSAILIHFTGVQSKTETTRTISIGRFYQSMQVLSKLKERYHSAGSAISFLLAVIRKHRIPIPMVEQLMHHQATDLLRTSSLHYTMPPSNSGPYPDIATSLSELAPVISNLDRHHSPANLPWTAPGQLPLDRFHRQDLQESYAMERDNGAIQDANRWTDWGGNAVLGSFPDMGLDFPETSMLSVGP